MRAGTAALIIAGSLMCTALPALAEPPEQARQPERQHDFQLDETFALGVVERRLDARSELIGWHLNGSWYLGREHGDVDEAVALIWQGDHHEQFSISTEGVRFTRRF